MEPENHPGGQTGEGSTPTFSVEDISTGAYAHGYGQTGDGRSYAFRVRRSTLYVEVYRADLENTFPDQSDLEATTQRSITEIDLTDERSIVAAVRDAVSEAEGKDSAHVEETTVRAFLGRIGSVIDGI